MITLIIVLVLGYFVWCAFRFPEFPDDYLVFLIGKKRSGKTTFLAWCSIHYWLRGRPVYATCPLPCARLIDHNDIGVYHFPKYAVIICDEVGLLWDNRNFKSFKEYHRNYFKLQGHYKHLVIMASQSHDVDKKIRDLCDQLGVVEKFPFFNLSRIRWISRKITLTEAEGDQPSSVTESLQWRFPLLGGNSFVYRPLFYPFFDSYEAPELEKKKFSIPAGMKHKFKRKQLIPIFAFWEYRLKLIQFPKFKRKLKESTDTAQISAESVSSSDGVGDTTDGL